MIKLIVFDIDGVITDGTLIVDVNGNEQKRINLKDIDAIFELHRRGYKLAAITREDTEIVSYFKKRFPWDYFFQGIKQKTDAIYRIQEQEKLSVEEICYVGDGKYDVNPLAYVGLGISPADAVDQAKSAAKIILQTDGGQGCLWELIPILETYNNSSCAEYFLFQRMEEHIDIFKRLTSNRKVMSNIMKVADKIVDVFHDGGSLFLCGNGGSAADAQHIASEFVGRFYKERPGLSAEALSVNTSILTEIGNDYSFERVFARQLEAKAKPGDMVIGISTSGLSQNVLEALYYARQHEIISVLLTGDYRQPHLEEQADYIIEVPSKVVPRIQEIHIFIGHVLAEYVEHELFKE